MGELEIRGFDWVLLVVQVVGWIVFYFLTKLSMSNQIAWLNVRLQNFIIKGYKPKEDIDRELTQLATRLDEKFDPLAAKVARIEADLERT